MANHLLLTSGLLLCLSTLSCLAFLDDGTVIDENKAFGCHGVTPPTNGVKGILSPTSFSRSSKLHSKYELKWKFNSTHILFQAEVEATSYVGLGISRDGGMRNSDIFVAWLDNNKDAHSSDRYVDEFYSVPTVDAHQDWELVSASQNGDSTTITSLRPLDPCDKHDMPIKAGKNNVIFAFGDGPTQGFYYHGINKGAKSINLLK